MNRSRDNAPELDYYELRRRHEEYKSRSRMAETEKTEIPAEKPAVQQAPAARHIAPEIKPEPQPAPRREVKQAPADVMPQIEEDEDLQDTLLDEEAFEDEFADEFEDEDAGANPNPFDPFLNFFKGVKGKMGGKKRAKKDRELDELDMLDDEEFTDEELEAAGIYDGELEFSEEAFAEAPVQQDMQPARSIYADEMPAAPARKVEDIADEADPFPARKAAAAVTYDEEDYGEDFDDEDFDDMDLEDMDFDGGKKRGGGFKKFLNLFVTRADKDEEDAGNESYYDEAMDDEPVYIAPAAAVSKGTKGGQDMDELNRTASVSGTAAPQDAEEAGMSRRERRERAMRLAAEEAARKAAEEAALAAEQAQQAETALDIPEEPVDMAAFKDASSDSIIESTVEDVVDEPTRVDIPKIDDVEESTRTFTPVSARSAQEDGVDEGLFALLDDEDEEDYADEEEDEEEQPRRKGLFARLRKGKQVVDDDEDEYDEDDEDEYDDADDEEEEDEDEEDEEDVRPARRGFARKNRKAVAVVEEEYDDDDEYDDDEDYDDEEDEYDDEDAYDDEYDDEDYDDEYEDEDEYDDEDEDDDYDDEDEFDDEEGGRSFGHHLVGFFKWIVGIAAVLVVAVIAINFLYINGSAGFVDKLHDKLGDENVAFDLLFPCYAIRETMPEPTVEPEATPEPLVSLPTNVPATIAPEATMSIPNLDDNDALTSATAAVTANSTQLPASVG